MKLRRRHDQRFTHVDAVDPTCVRENCSSATPGQRGELAKARELLYGCLCLSTCSASDLIELASGSPPDTAAMDFPFAITFVILLNPDPYFDVRTVVWTMN